MLVQTTTPRPIFDHSKNPTYLYVHTLRKPGISAGTVFFAGPTDPEHGQHGTVELDPFQTWPIEGGEEGFEACEYILPFWRLFQRDPNAKPIMYDGRPVEESNVRAGSVRLTRYCTAGFGVVAHSAFRANPREYQEHTVSFKIIMPVTGGGILRLSDSFFDIANPTFDPWAADPRKQLPIGNPKYSEEQIAYSRTHRLDQSSEARRQARLASVAAGTALTFEDTPENKGLPPGVTREPLLGPRR